MNPKLLRKRWRRELTANLQQANRLLNRHGSLDPDAVHDLRVALRRSRLLLQLRTDRHDHGRIKRFRAAARKTMDAFAPVRDGDVTVEWARAQGASAKLLTTLRRRRAAAGRRASRQLSPPKIKRLLERLKQTGKAAPEKLARRFHCWFSALATHSVAAASQAAQLPDSRLHTLRRNIRRWRYLCELTVAPRRVTRDPMICRMVTVQDALGEVQTLRVVLAALKNCGRAQEVATLKQTARLRLGASQATARRELQQLSIEQMPVRR